MAKTAIIAEHLSARQLIRECSEISTLVCIYKNIFQKMKENVGISKPKKHTNKIGMVP